jgi:hypothetical protein
VFTPFALRSIGYAPNLCMIASRASNATLQHGPHMTHGQWLHEGAAANLWAAAELRAAAATRAAAKLLVVVIGGVNTP